MLVFNGSKYHVKPCNVESLYEWNLKVRMMKQKYGEKCPSRSKVSLGNSKDIL